MLNSGSVFLKYLKTAADFADQSEIRGFFFISAKTPSITSSFKSNALSTVNFSSCSSSGMNVLDHLLFNVFFTN